MCQLANYNPRTLVITSFGVVGTPANSCQLCQPGEVQSTAFALLAADPYRDKVGWVGLVGITSQPAQTFDYQGFWECGWQVG
jgi:hypothetical protein